MNDRLPASCSFSIAEGGFGEGKFGGAEQLVVELDNGSKQALSAIIENVMAMRERL